MNSNMTMESLALSRDYWDLKLEPQSPQAAVRELFALNDPTANFVYDDNFANGISLMSDEDAICLQESINSITCDEDVIVEFLDLKDEECLLDQKASQYIDYETTGFPQQLDVVLQDILPATKVQIAANNNNLADFQQTDSLILQQLTPPQSPPQFDAYQQQQQQAPQELVKEEHKLLPFATDAAVTVTITAAADATAAASYNFNNWVPVSEIVRETQLVDDIVNMRAQELQQWQQYNDDCESQASSSVDSSSSSDVSGAGSSIADEEWLPESSSSSPAHTIIEEQQSSAGASDSSSSSGSGAKKRTRTYGRGVEDRKIRKKEQNKNAATRYRQKKKMEMEHVLGEEQQLVQANEELRRKLGECRHESRYLRQLIREFYKQRKQ